VLQLHSTQPIKASDDNEAGLMTPNYSLYGKNSMLMDKSRLNMEIESFFPA